MSDPTAAAGAAGWERCWGQPELSRRWRVPEPAVLEWVRSLDRGSRVLDLGCGVGRHVLALAQEGLWLVGSDLSPAGLRACAIHLRRDALPVRLVLHDMQRLPFADACFDALLAFHVVYHTTVKGLRATLAEIHRVLRPGGCAYLTFLGRLEERIADFRADVARGICAEVEPFTFVYLRDAPGDKDILHHYVDEAELRALLAPLRIEALVPVHGAWTEANGEPRRSLHYHVQAVK